MSDDRVLGYACCGIKRTTLILVVAIFLSLYGIYHILRATVFLYTTQKSITPTHCSGSRCLDILTCDGLQEASWHLKEVVLVLGGAVFGSLGAYGVLHKFPKDVFFYGVFLCGLAVLNVVVLLWDFIFLWGCRRYSYNVMDEAVLWNFPNLPVRNGIKYEVRLMESYPWSYIDTLTHRRVGVWYLGVEIAEIAFWAFIAYQAFLVAERLYYGLIGLGANFSIDEWREKVLLKFQLGDIMYNTMDLAAATFDDVGWEYDGPIRHYKWYGRPVMGAPQYNMPQGPRADFMPSMSLPGGPSDALERAYEAGLRESRSVL